MSGLFSLVKNPPPGFVYRTPSKRELLTGHIALLVSEPEDAFALLADFRKRVKGLVISPGHSFSHVEFTPQLWHLNVPPEYLGLLQHLSVCLMGILEKNDQENEKKTAVIAELTYNNQFFTQTQDGYNKAMGRLQAMVQEAHRENEKRQAVIAQLNHEIRERKKAQEEQLRLESRLHQSMKMEAIGLMAGGVAHDLNNILAGVVGYPDILLSTLPEESNLRQPLENIRESGRRAAEVVADLLTIARSSANPCEVISPNEIICQFLDSLEFKRLKSIHPNITFQLDLDDSLDNIACSVSHVKKCFMNLVINGAEAINNSGFLRITTRSQEVTQDEQNGTYVLTKGRYAVVRVEDNGEGIADEHLTHIFEPFYSRKRMGSSGTGLGLTVVWNTVQEHGGFIRVNSSSEGTTFELFFPATTQLPPEQRTEISLEHILGNQETIMVVDDEKLLLDISETMLLSLGYQVIAKDSGEEAIEYLHHHKVDLLILDMIMEPGINGCQTYEEVLKFRPGQRAIIASGFAKNEDVNRVLRLGATSFLRKPYTIKSLGKAIKEALVIQSEQ